MQDFSLALEAPTAQVLHEAALAHLARFATTRQGLRQILLRRVRRWGMKAEKAGGESEEIASREAALQDEIEKILDAMTGLRAIDDENFARSRTRSLLRSGRSRRAVQAHLLTKGVESDLVEGAVTETLEHLTEESGADAELVAALILARKRAVGPFTRPDREAKEPEKIMAVFARNGFSRDLARRALTMEKDEAEEMIWHFRSL
ncbi:regulatory protein RecX [Acetobacteraceae bacterium ESL0709]|nr:regulatory protein RecX [Acetobacteraceae bacterium ESL0697]MDF7678496.1 regulatory protein RecX [Acetobacteraceae bacterium ESL0709]